MWFGRDVNPYEPGNPIYNLIMNENIKDDWTQNLAFMEAYDTAFKIHDHENSDHPFSIIGMHPAEDATTGDSISHLMAELISCRIPEVTNTPLLQLMEQYPRWRLNKLIEQGRKARNKEEKALEGVERSIDNAMPDA
jgi:hypothetical protein